MPYLKNIVREVLRLYPPRMSTANAEAYVSNMPAVGFNVRTAIEDTSLPVGSGSSGSAPVGILKGTQIIYSVIGMQRRNDIFGADATVFRPERWESWSPSKWEYAPFNHGPRVCLGQSFAISHMRYALCRIFQKYETISLARPETEQKAMRLELNIKPASPVICTFRPSGVIAKQ